MDGERFDDLARLLARPLPRRRLLRQAAGTLIGVVLAGRAGVVRAQQTCADCIDRGLACCTYDLYILCRAADQTCCGPIICSAGYACVGGFCVACPPENRCGTTCCSAEQDCENEECVAACPTGTTRCGTSNCCSEGQDCSDGECVDACPVGVTSEQDGRRRSRQREVTAEAVCCPEGTSLCGNECVTDCPRKKSLDYSTCTCTKKKCEPGTRKCDGKCVDTANDPDHCGGCAGNGGESCGNGLCCLGRCRAPGTVCCGDQICGPGQSCCGREGTVCCAEAQCCGRNCCGLGTFCVNAKHGTCCPLNHTYCNAVCCPPGTVCASFRNSACCANDTPKYCPKSEDCAVSRRAC